MAGTCRGVLVKRYKRFLADVRLADGKLVTAHCPNTGSMQGCSEAGRRVYLPRHGAPQRKLKYTIERKSCRIFRLKI
jgi:sugar fermentation stimulation protein A